MSKRKQQAGKATEQVREGRRDRDGRFMGVRIADPPVKPRGTTVREIRRAVAAVLGRRSA
jgi:predicted TIM-barrel fold metal-dependent hydrolase